MKNLIQDGKTIQYTVADLAVKSGDIVVIEDIAGIAVTDGNAGDSITLSIEGVYSLPKGSGAIAKGKKVYVNVTEGVATIVTTASSNTFIGYAWADAGAGEGKVDVKLSF
jgi:predicted RecA/RadA family phage recombinase